MLRSKTRCGPPACRCRRWCERSRAMWWPISGRRRVRVYEWVDLGRRDPWLDPATVGRLVASIHRVRYLGQNPVDPWYTDPVGADTWDDIVSRLAAAGAVFAEPLAEMRDELVALEALLEWPANLQTCHRDLFADNILRTPAGSLSVIDWENSGLADPGQELGSGAVRLRLWRGRSAAAISTAPTSMPVVRDVSSGPATSRWSSPSSPTSERFRAVDGSTQRWSRTRSTTPDASTSSSPSR